MQPVGDLDAPPGQRHPLGSTWRKTLPTALAQQLTEAKLRLGFSYRQLEQVTGISNSHLCRIFNGTRCPSRPFAHRIIRVLDLPGTVIDDLLDESVVRRFPR